MAKKKKLIKVKTKKICKKKSLVQKEHPWRICPIDHHWVRPQIKHKKPSKLHPDGVVPYEGFCRINPSHKSSIYSEELSLIAEKYFKGLGKKLASDPSFLKKGEAQFNDSIVGWTQYWNDILKPKEKLEPELVKALIATESGYRINVTSRKAGKAGMARGMLQVTDQAQQVMDSSKSEIKDYLVHVTQKELKDPNLNIAAGVRWLFHKKKLTESTLGRDASWYETIVFYKGYGDQYLASAPLSKMKGASDIIDAYRRISGKDLKR